ACENPGEVVDCGHVERRSGSYVACSLGKRTCNGGSWGACVGDTIRELQTFRPPSGLLSLGKVSSCDDNPCDPYCLNYIDDPNGLDGGVDMRSSDGGFVLVRRPPPVGPV